MRSGDRTHRISRGRHTRERTKHVQAYRINAKQLITHHVKLVNTLDAYETFDATGETNALKARIEA